MVTCKSLAEWGSSRSNRSLAGQVVSPSPPPPVIAPASSIPRRIASRPTPQIRARRLLSPTLSTCRRCITGEYEQCKEARGELRDDELARFAFCRPGHPDILPDMVRIETLRGYGGVAWLKRDVHVELVRALR